MASRTQIVCLCEGRKGQSIDEVFINAVMWRLRPSWVRPWKGSNIVLAVPCGSRTELIDKMPVELRNCLAAGGDTTLMVWADCDHDCDDPEALKALFWQEAQRRGTSKADFDRVVFILAKDRLENWIEFLLTGVTHESEEGPRVKHGKAVADAAKKLADFCKTGKPLKGLPPSLLWSCQSYRAFSVEKA